MSNKFPFDFEIDIHGARVIVTREALHPACLSDTEVDYNISELKKNLDQLAIEMKRAIKEQRKEPLLLRET